MTFAMGGVPHSGPQQWYMYIIEYYSAIKKNKIMPFAVPEMDLGGLP